MANDILDAASFLASSVRFCWDVSSQLQRLSGEVTEELRENVASKLCEIARNDSKNLERFKDNSRGTASPPWWLLANVLVAIILCCSRGWSLVLLLFLAILNGSCIVAKVGFDQIAISSKSLKDYVVSNAKLVLALAMLTLPVIPLNLGVWGIVHFATSLAKALPLPELFINPLPENVLQHLSSVLLCSWIAAKLVMLLEILVNHQYYRNYLAKRRQTIAPSISFHFVDALYGFSYSVLALCCANTMLEHFAFLQRTLLPGCWSPMGILLLLSLRGPFLPLTMKIKALTYFCMHRLLHVQPFYTCWHKEHFSASQTCLTGCQEAGLLESAAEVLYTHMAFVLVPFVDNIAYLWAAIFNSMNHHYYEEYKDVHWKVAKWMLFSQRHCRMLLSKLEPFTMPGFSGTLAENLQFPSADFKSPWLGLGSVERTFHGRHHWTTERHFGYGTYDSVSNLGAKFDVDQAEREKLFRMFVEEYVALLTGQIQTASIVNRPIVASKEAPKPVA